MLVCLFHIFSMISAINVHIYIHAIKQCSGTASYSIYCKDDMIYRTWYLYPHWVNIWLSFSRFFGIFNFIDRIIRFHQLPILTTFGVRISIISKVLTNSWAFDTKNKLSKRFYFTKMFRKIAKNYEFCIITIGDEPTGA